MMTAMPRGLVLALRRRIAVKLTLTLVGFVALAEDNAAGLDEFGFDVVAGQDGKAGSCLSFGPSFVPRDTFYDAPVTW